MSADGNKAQATTSKDLSFFDLDLDAFKWVFDLNVTGAVLTTMVFGELLAKQGYGNVINIASMASYHPLTNTVAYRAPFLAISFAMTPQMIPPAPVMTAFFPAMSKLISFMISLLFPFYFFKNARTVSPAYSRIWAADGAFKTSSAA